MSNLNDLWDSVVAPEPVKEFNMLDPRTNAPFGAYSEDDIKESAIENQAVDMFGNLGFQGVPSPPEADWNVRSLIFKEGNQNAPLKKELTEVMRHEWDTSRAFSQAYSFADRITSGQDQDAITQGLELYKKAKEMQAQLPPANEGISYIREMARGSSQMAGQLLHVTSEAAPDVARHVTEGAAVGTVVPGAGTMTGAMVGLQGGAAIEVTKQFYIQSKSEILFNLIDPDQKEPIPVEIALPIAKTVGFLSAGLEGIGLAGVFKSAGVAASVAKRATGIATEGGTEAAQEVLGQYARYLADQKLAEFRNSPFEKTFDDYLDMYQAQQAARGAIMSTVGLSIPGTAYRGIAKTPELVDRFYEKAYSFEQAKIAERQIQADVTQQKEAEAKAGVPIEDTVDTLTNTLVEGEPITNSELAETVKQSIIRGTNIKDSEIDNLTVSTEEDIDEQLNVLDSRISESYNEPTANFIAAIYDRYPMEEAEAAEKLIEARAGSMGMSMSQYVSHRGLEFDAVNAESVDAEAFVQFTDDNKTIIHAFKNSTIVDFVHEIGHVFRRDLIGDDAKVADEFVGSLDGKWTVVEEEKFAKAWERYLAEGKAPVQGLESVFKRMADWFARVYKAIRGSDINVDIHPDLKVLFDRMLTENAMVNEQATSEMGNKPHIAMAEQFGFKVERGATPSMQSGFVIFPDMSSLLFQQTFGADKKTVMAHEIAHGLLSKWSMTGEIKGPTYKELRKELRTVSRTASAKKWEVASRHADKSQELLADGIAHLINNPNAALPELKKLLGSRVQELTPKAKTTDTIKGLGNTEDLLSALTQSIANDLKTTRQKAEEVGIIYGEEFAKLHEGQILFSKKRVLDKERLEDTDQADDTRAETLKAYTDKVTREYGREVGGVKRMTGLSKREMDRMQKYALVNAMKKMFDAGDKHGYKMAKAALKAFLIRRHSLNAMQRKHKALRESFLRKLKLGKAYKQGGRRFVKMDPKIATFLRDVDHLLKDAHTLKGAKKLYDQVSAGFATNAYVSPEQALAFRYIQSAVRRTLESINEMKHLNGELSALINGARTKSPAYERRNKLEQSIGVYLKEIRGEESSMAKEHTDTTTEATRLRETREKGISVWTNWREAVKLSTRGQYLYGSLTSNIKNISAYSGAVNSMLFKAFDFFQENQVKMTEIRKTQEKVMAKYAEIFGLTKPDSGAIGRAKTEYKTFEQWKKDTTRSIDIGLGNLYSRSELRYLYMLAKDSTLTNRLVNMGFGATKLTLIDSLLTPQDKAFSDWMIAYFNDDNTYNAINEVYKDIYGVDLGRRGYYVPVRADQFVPDIDGFNSIGMDEFATNMQIAQFQMDHVLRTSDNRSLPTSSGRLKERSTKTDKIPLAIMGDMALMSSFVTEMAHFKAYAIKAQHAAGILNDKRIRRAVTIEYGQKILTNIAEQLKSVMSDGANTRELYGRVDAVRNAWVFSSVAAAGSVFIKQLIGSVQYWEHMPISEYIGYSMELLTDPSKIKILLDSDYIKNRISHIDRDLKDARTNQEYRAYQLNPTITNFLSLNIRLGDSLAIAVGGYSLYRYYTKDLKMSHDDAILEVSRVSESTQQSGMQQELTRIQTGGSIAKFVSVYSSAPIQAARKEVQAVKDYAAGKISAKQLAKTIFIYHILVPGLFAGIGQLLQGGDDGEDEAAKSMAISIALGPFGSAYAFAEVLTYAASRIVGAHTFTPSSMATDLADNMVKVYQEMFEDKEMKIDDFAQAAEAVLVLKGIGVPVKRGTRFVENMAEGSPVRAVLGQKALEEE